MQSGHRTFISIIIAATWMGCGALLAGCSGQDAGAGAGGFTPPPMPVETAVVTREPVSDRFEGVGTIEAGEDITVVSEIDGTVVSLPFQEGGRLDQGDLIARLDDIQLQAEMDRAQAVRDQNQSTYDRVQSVVEQGAGTPQDLDDAAAALKVAEADLALARSRLAKTRITAPFAGNAGSRRVSTGAFIRAGQPITSLAKLEEIRVLFSVPERYLGKIGLGVPVTITTTAYPGVGLEGKVTIIEPLLDEATRSARIIATARNPEGKFRPGMSANVVAVLSERQEALTLASEAVFFQGGQSLVYVINADSSVTRTPVVLGTRMAAVVEVLSGLQAGSRVVRTGHQKLFEGAKVMPIDAAPAEGTVPVGDPQESEDGTQ